MTPPQIPAQRVRPRTASDPDATVRTDLHRSPAGQLVKVEVFRDGSTRVTAAYPDGRWHPQPFTPEVAW